MMGIEVVSTQNTAVKVQLGELSLQDVDKSGPTNCKEFIYVDISSIDRETKKVVDAKRLPITEAPSRAKQVLRTGDVIVSMTRPNLNAIAKVTASLDGAIGSTGFHIIRSKYIEPDFIYYLVQTREFVEAMCKCVQGALYPAVRPSDISSFEFLLPPQPEQQRIVARIEELFSELDKGVENLRTAQQQLKVYRQALLKQAFEGKLTADWRAQNPDKLESTVALLARIQQKREARYQQQLQEWRKAQQTWEASGKAGSKPSKPKTPGILSRRTTEELAGLAELPKGWAWQSIEPLLSFEKKPMTTGPFGTLLSKPDYRSSGLPVLGIENIGDGVFIKGNKIFVSEEKALELSSFSVEPGDLIISRSGTVGEICKVPDHIGVAYISTNLIRITLDKETIDPDYFVFLFQGGAVKQLVKNLCKGSSRAFLNQTILSSISFPIPCLEEQRMIVNSIEEKFSIIDQLEQTITHSLQQAEALRQSILKKAFSGQLVAQDPNDEPASVLLERIRAERAAQPKARGRKAKASA